MYELSRVMMLTKPRICRPLVLPLIVAPNNPRWAGGEIKDAMALEEMWLPAMTLRTRIRSKAADESMDGQEEP